MAKQTATKRTFDISATETRKPRRARRIRISSESTLQQLHLALLAAFDYGPAYTTADRLFTFACKNTTYTYDTAGLQTLRDLFSEGTTGTYTCSIAGVRAAFAVVSEAPTEKRARYPLVYEAAAATPHRLFSDNARFGAGYRYLKYEARPESKAFRDGVYAGVIAGPPAHPAAYLKWILPDEMENGVDLNALLDERMREHNVVADALLHDPDRYISDFGARFASRDALLDWTFGFVFAMSLNIDEWQSTIASNEDWAHSFQPIAVMMDIADDAPRWPWLDDRSLQESVALSLPMATCALYQRWRERLFPEVARRVAPKVGANQPCPCGSGKKYKRCCGSPLRAV